LIFILRILIEESNEWRTEIIMAFIDFLMAFDPVHRDSPWKILHYYGFPDKIVRNLMALYDEQMCAVWTDDRDPTGWFKVNSGI
jgi:hypothetical protein